MTSADQAMITAAQALFANLTEEGREIARHPFDAAARTQWSYLPGPRPGIALSDLNVGARKAAHRLLATALSRSAFAQAVTIMALEEVLDLDEQGRLGRHSNSYYAAVFGSPGGDRWAWRFEGHHLSVNVTVTAGRPLIGPLFMGANPARVRRGGEIIIAPLLSEEELAQAIIAGLRPPLRDQALALNAAPGDIITATASTIGKPLQPLGLPATRLPGECREQLERLLGIYLDRLAPDLAGVEHDRLAEADTTFAWAGGQAKGEAFYYRIQAPSLLIEYQNSQRNDGHAHTVIRRPGDDFGAFLTTE